MKTVKAESGDINFSRKRPVSSALQRIDNKNSLDQDIAWPRKVARVIATDPDQQSPEDSVLRASKTANMNADATNNNNGVKEEEVGE